MMFRLLLILTLTAAIVGIGAADALAQHDGQWPSLSLQANWRGPGFYLSWIKILACWLVFLFWVRTTDWISQRRPGAQAELPAVEPDLFGMFSGGLRAGVADSLLLVRLPVAGDRLRRAAVDLRARAQPKVSRTSG